MTILVFFEATIFGMFVSAVAAGQVRERHTHTHTHTHYVHLEELDNDIHSLSCH